MGSCLSFCVSSPVCVLAFLITVYFAHNIGFMKIYESHSEWRMARGGGSGHHHLFYSMAIGHAHIDTIV